MRSLPGQLDQIEQRITAWVARHGDLVLVSAAIVVGATVRGGRLSAATQTESARG
jgi:hypothetical protein